MKRALTFAPFGVFLFILPFPGTVALRLLCLAMAFSIAMVMWRKLAPLALPYKPAYGFWIFVTVVSLFYAVDPGYSAGEIKNEIGYAMMAMAAFFVFIDNESKFKWCCIAVLLALATISIWALALYAWQGFWDDSRGHGGTGTFATYVLIAIPILFLSWSKMPKWRGAIVVIGLLGIVAAGYARQRAFWPVLGFQAVLIGLFVWGVGATVAHRLRRVAIVVLISVAGAGMFAATQYSRLSMHGSGISLENDGRLSVWPNVVATIVANPLTGAGFGRNAMKLGYPELLSPDTPMFWHAHNLFLNYGLAMGLPGIFALLFLFGAIALTYWRMIRCGNQLIRPIGIAGLALLAAVILRNQTNDFFQRDLSLYFWAMNGVFLGYALRLQRLDEKPIG